MILELKYLVERHRYWKEEIAKAGIWDSSLFKPVEIIIRKNHRKYNALFHRRILRKGIIEKIEDKIIVYNKAEDFDQIYLDSLLVHEMIHQYLVQNKLGEKQSHGPTFRRYMQLINNGFPDKLKITLKSETPGRKEGPGDKQHILIVVRSGGYAYFCVINEKKAVTLNKLAKSHKRKGIIKDYYFAQSNDLHFNNFRRCNSTLHGEKTEEAGMKAYCAKYGVNKINLK